MVPSSQTWFQGVGLFEVQNPVVRESFIQHALFPLGLDEQGNEIFVRFIPHNRARVFVPYMAIRLGGLCSLEFLWIIATLDVSPKWLALLGNSCHGNVLTGGWFDIWCVLLSWRLHWSLVT